MSKRKDEPNWRSGEKVAAILEKLLAPSATVKQNVFLPVIGQPRRKPRQCDVVITYGEEPRQNIAIVEVQKRNRKPDITTFHGWLAKMREVGAQQLICVSALGYPQSIIEEVATRIGPTVTLMTLQELDRVTEPGHIIISFLISSTPKYQFEEIGVIKLEGAPAVQRAELSSHDKLFSIGDSVERLNLYELTTNALNNTLPPMFRERGIEEPDSYSIELVFNFKTQGLWIHLSDQRFKVAEWPIKLKIERQLERIPVTNFAYRQESIEGVLAWIASAKMVVQGKEQELRIVFKPDSNGLLQVTAVLQSEGVAA